MHMCKIAITGHKFPKFYIPDVMVSIVVILFCEKTAYFYNISQY